MLLICAVPLFSSIGGDSEVPRFGIFRRPYLFALTRGLTILLICEKLSPFGVLSPASLQLGEADVGLPISSLIVAAERGDRPA